MPRESGPEGYIEPALTPGDECPMCAEERPHLYEVTRWTGWTQRGIPTPITRTMCAHCAREMMIVAWANFNPDQHAENDNLWPRFDYHEED